MSDPLMVHVVGGRVAGVWLSRTVCAYRDAEARRHASALMALYECLPWARLVQVLTARSGWLPGSAAAGVGVADVLERGGPVQG